MKIQGKNGRGRGNNSSAEISPCGWSITDQEDWGGKIEDRQAVVDPLVSHTVPAWFPQKQSLRQAYTLTLLGGVEPQGSKCEQGREMSQGRSKDKHKPGFSKLTTNCAQSGSRSLQGPGGPSQQSIRGDGRRKHASLSSFHVLHHIGVSLPMEFYLPYFPCSMEAPVRGTGDPLTGASIEQGK